MRWSRSSRGGGWWLTAAALLAPFLGAGCTLVQPGCRNRDVKAAIEQDARESLDLTGSTSGLPVASADTKVSLVDQVEVGRHDNTRSCTGNVAVGIGRETVQVPIEYEVTAGADGEGFYQWDKFSFGQKMLGTAVMSALLDMAHAKTAPQNELDNARQSDVQQDTPAAPDTPPAPIPWPQNATAPSNVVDAWKREVRNEIAHRAEKLTNMPIGKQAMRFRIGPDGEITMARALPPIENANLADRLVTFLDSSDTVPRPPLGKAVWIDVVFRL